MDFAGLPLGVLDSFLASLAANAAFLFGGGMLYFLLVAARARRLYRFLGIGSDNRLVVYLSRLEIKPDGLSDVYGEAPDAVALGLNLGEFQETKALVHLLSRRPEVSCPSQFAAFVDTVFQGNRPNLEFLAAPARASTREALERCATICLGGPRYNRATELYLLESEFHLDFERRDGTLGYDVGYLAKLLTQEHRTIVLAAGLGENGTRAAIRHLLQNWEQLANTPSDQSFLLTLVCPNNYTDLSGYERSVVVDQGAGETEDKAWIRLRSRIQSSGATTSPSTPRPG